MAKPKPKPNLPPDAIPVGAISFCDECNGAGRFAEVYDSGVVRIDVGGGIVESDGTLKVTVTLLCQGCRGRGTVEAGVD